MEGLEETIQKFRTSIIADSNKLNSFKIISGHKKSKKIPRFGRINNSIEQLENLLSNYRDGIFDENLKFAGTYIHPCVRISMDWETKAKQGFFSDSEMAVDSLIYFLPNSSYFSNIPTTSFYDEFTKWIVELYSKLDKIRQHIFQQNPELNEYENNKDGSKLGIAKKIYLQNEFEKRDEVIPLLIEMLEIYKNGKILVDGVVKGL